MPVFFGLTTLLAYPLMLFLFASAVCAALIFIILKSGCGTRLLDNPTARSLHQSPTPRIGGIAILLTLAVIGVYQSLEIFASLALPLALLAVVSIIDDYRQLPILARLSAHFTAALLFVYFALDPRLGVEISIPPFWLSALCLLTLIGMMNLYNFMDGANGLAGAMTLIGFASYGLAAVASNENGLANFSILISGAALGFLIFNFPKAKVFMGDTGSVPLGFLAAAVGMLGTMNKAWPWWFGPLVFSPFILDATLTLLRRMAHGEKFWQAHREHYYQRLILCGWSHARLTLWASALMLGCAASSLLVILSLLPLAALSGWVVIYLLIIIALERRLPKKIKHE